jgi:hypothetical protein
MNLFAQATNTQATTKTKKDDKLLVTVKDKKFDQDLNRFAELDSQIKELSAELDIVKSTVKDVCYDEFVKLYTDNKRNPGSFNVTSETGARVMFLPTDKYLKIDKDRNDELVAEYGDNITEVDTEFGFNKAMLDKYAEVISRMITECEEIDDADKAKIITAKTTYKVKSGSIDDAFTTGKGDVENYLEDLNIVSQLKMPKGSK